MYKKLLFLLLIGIAASRSYAQNYDVLTYAITGTPTNGVKIKTNLPFTDGSQMPTLIFEGYNYVG